MLAKLTRVLHQSGEHDPCPSSVLLVEAGAAVICCESRAATAAYEKSLTMLTENALNESEVGASEG